jgi:hypothetical protein
MELRLRPHFRYVDAFSSVRAILATHHMLERSHACFVSITAPTREMKCQIPDIPLSFRDAGYRCSNNMCKSKMARGFFHRDRLPPAAQCVASRSPEE